MTDFGGTYKSFSLIMSSVFIPILIWQYNREFAKEVKASRDEIKQRFSLKNIYEAIGEIERLKKQNEELKK